MSSGTSPPPRVARVRALLLVAVCILARTRSALADPIDTRPHAPVVLTPPPASAPLATTPALSLPAEVGAYVSRPITRVTVLVEDDAWPMTKAPEVTTIRPGQPLTAAAVRSAMIEVLQSGKLAHARVTAAPDPNGGNGVVLTMHVVQRRLVESLRLELHGMKVDTDELLREADLAEGGEVLGAELPQTRRRIENYLARRGYPNAQLAIESRETDDPTRVLVLVDVRPSPPRTLQRRAFYVFGASAPELSTVLETYRVGTGDRADETAMDAADAALEGRLHARGFHRAQVTHDVVLASSYVTLRVRIDTGPKFVARFEGNDHYDSSAIRGALGLEDEIDLSPGHLAQKLRDFYTKRGWLDVEVNVESRGEETDPVRELVFRIAEHARVEVTSRAYPCLKEDDIRKLKEGGPDSVNAIGSEIDSFLEEELPGADIVRTPDPRGLDATISGPGTTTGARAQPIDLSPDATYVAETYERAMAHVQELYRNEGYLHAQVGPARVLRRTCDRRSPPGRCIPVPPPRPPTDLCRYDATNLPLPSEPLDPAYTCVPDPVRHIECEPRVALRIPILLGPRTSLYDMTFDGARSLPETALAKAVDLPLGPPVNTVKIEESRRRLLEAYKEEGYAFVDVKYTLEPSVDHTRARLRFEITEGEQVIVRSIVVRGNEVTNDVAIRRRIALEVGKPYRTSDRRKTEERLATLGVFSNITVALEDPYVPNKHKVVIVTLIERTSKYIELRPGFSTGEGIRGTIEFGDRNITGNAIAFTARATASYLPNDLILDPQVRDNYENHLSKGFSSKRLATRLTLGLAFPEIGLGPLLRSGLDGVYVHDLQRDFILTKFAAIPSLNFRPLHELQFTASESFELNEVDFFSQENNVVQYLNSHDSNADLSRLLRLPDGKSYALAQRVVVTWDRRDNSFNAHSGFFLSSGVEHVDWYGLRGENDQGVSQGGHFFKFTETAAAYFPITKRIALAAEIRLGNIVQTTSTSTTYPDRFFFLGGVDSLRGWAQDSFVPQEYADLIASQRGLPTPDANLRDDRNNLVPVCTQRFDVKCVPIRGGNLMINPKVELRIPVRPPLETVLFVDAGNMWVDPNYPFSHGFSLRYAAGTGIRIQTPVGPLAFDYGVNMSRLIAGPHDPRSGYEDFGAFHFAIGLF